MGTSGSREGTGNSSWIALNIYCDARHPIGNGIRFSHFPAVRAVAIAAAPSWRATSLGRVQTDKPTRRIEFEKVHARLVEGRAEVRLQIGAPEHLGGAGF